MGDSIGDYPVTIEVPVAWGEMDAFQHVNNIVYFRYFESARIAYFDKIGIWEFMEADGVGPILASTRCSFKIPLAFPDTVTVGARVSRLERDRFMMQYGVFSEKHGKLAAHGEGLIVYYNYRENHKASVPPPLTHRIEELEGLKME